MFGCIVAGRFVQTNAQVVGEGKYMFTLEDAASINHIVVFLLGTTPMPAGFGAAVYFAWPPHTEWKYLGFVSNEKPSAVFRLGSVESSKTGFNSASGVAEVEMAPSNVVAQLGLSIESLQTIQQQTIFRDQPASTYAASPANLAPSDIAQFAQKILQNLFNFAMSFSKPGSFGFGGTITDSIPTETFKKWYSNTESKIQKDPQFWKYL